jgi:hypothetical protein
MLVLELVVPWSRQMSKKAFIDNRLKSDWND